MLKFFLDKFRESPGPFKQARLVLGDIIEELVDVAAHYIKPRTEEEKAPLSEPIEEPPPPPQSKKAALPQNQSAKKKRTRTSEPIARNLDVLPELLRALDAPSNQKKQEFKVLAILWDAHQRGISDFSAKNLAEHGTKLGLTIRHENVRKVIRMQLSSYVDLIQNRKAGSSIYHYRINAKGISYFEEEYFQKSQTG